MMKVMIYAELIGNYKKLRIKSHSDNKIDAGYVHDGTYKMGARPFLETAAEAEIGGLEERIIAAIERLL